MPFLAEEGQHQIRWAGTTADRRIDKEGNKASQMALFADVLCLIKVLITTVCHEN